MYSVPEQQAGLRDRHMKDNGSIVHMQERNELWKDLSLMPTFLLRGNDLCNGH
jgi:hypothetical protein